MTQQLERAGYTAEGYIKPARTGLDHKRVYSHSRPDRAVRQL